MEKFTATIEAESREAALQQAISMFSVSSDNVELVQAGNGIFVAAVKDMDARVTVTVSDDNMQVLLKEACHARGVGAPLGEEILEKAFREASVTVAPAADALERIRDALSAGDELEGMVLAEGNAPIDGWDGIVELAVHTDIAVGEEDEHHRVDYHERGFVETVEAGKLLGKLTFPTEGRPGLDVYGKPVAAKSGKCAIFEAGENVEVTESGEIRACTGGMIQYVHSVLSISEVLEHGGDVDFHTGNIHMKTGSINVKGTVLPGFEVSASGNVVIGKTIKEAKIVSGGDIEIRQGVIDAELIAKGSVYARFVQNAKIVADGDVVVANNLHNCEVIAGDSVKVTTGKGIVRGGHIVCSKWVEAKEVGSPSEVDTQIELGRRSEDENIIVEERAAVNEAIREINLFLGCEDSAVPDLSGKSEKEVEAIQKVLETLKELQAKRIQLSSLLAAKTKERLQCCQFKVAVYKTVYPGTHISIMGRAFLVKQPLSRCVFFYDQEKDKVVVESM